MSYNNSNNQNNTQYIKYYNRDNWVIQPDQDKRYNDIRDSLKAMDVLKPANSNYR